MSPPPTTKAVELPREQYLKLTRDHELLTSKVKELTASLAEAEGRARRAEQEAAELRRQLRAVDRGETRPSSPPRPVRTHIVSPPPLATWNTASLAPGCVRAPAALRRAPHVRSRAGRAARAPARPGPVTRPPLAARPSRAAARAQLARRERLAQAAGGP